MRPFHNAHSRAVEQQPRHRRAPHDLVDDAVGAVGGVGDTVAVEVESAVVAPIIAALPVAPFDIAGAHIFHLALVIDKSIVENAVALGRGGEMNAHFAVFKMVAADGVVVGIIDKHAFFGFVDHIAGDARMVGIIEHQALVTAVEGDIVGHFQALGKHNRIADVVAV